MPSYNTRQIAIAAGLGALVILAALVAIAANTVESDDKQQPVASEGERTNGEQKGQQQNKVSEQTTFTASGGDGSTPAVTEITFDPDYVSNGQQQRFIVTVEESSTSSVERVKGSIPTDSGTSTVSFQKTGEQEGSSTWTGEWEVRNLGEEQYYPIALDVRATSGNTEDALIYFAHASVRTEQ